MAGIAHTEKQVAVITGAARGIGEAVAARIATMGMHVVLVARDRERLARVQEALGRSGGSASILPLDLRDPECGKRLLEALQPMGSRCDVLINNAAVGRTGKQLHEMSIEEWNEVMETNLRAPFLMVRAVTPLMMQARGGDIINISSLAGTGPLPGGAAYSASKWGLNGLTYSLAEELREYGIRVAVIAPGSVNTGFGGSGADAERAPRKLQPEDIADIVETLIRQPARSFISEVRVRPTSKK